MDASGKGYGTVVVIKYALAGLSVVAGLIAYSHRDAVTAAYAWEPTIERPRIPSFDPKAVAEAHQLPLPAGDLRVATAPDTRTVGLPALAAPGPTTTTAPAVQGGEARIEGVVLTPSKTPMAGATVRLERLVGEASVAVDLSTNTSGAFAIDGLLGGRYRIRAWRSPTYTQMSSEVTFLADGEKRSLVLALDAPNRLDVYASASPSTVIVGQAGTVNATVVLDVVNGEGQVDKMPRPNETVTMTGSGVLAGQNGQAVTTAMGAVSFPFRCTQVGNGTLLMSSGVARQDVTVTCAAVPSTTTTRAGTTAVTR